MKGTPIECIAYLTEQPHDKTFEVKEAKRKRSLTANAYYWAMLNKLARKLHMGDSELHKHMLREYSVCDVFDVSMKVPIADYFKYFDVLGVDWNGTEERRTVKVYKGSSQMNSSEFSCLIEGMREECERQGINVMTPQEIAKLRFVEPERI